MTAKYPQRKQIEECIKRAKARVIAAGSNAYAFVCVDASGPAVWDLASYEREGNEKDCVAAVWSYRDGSYDDANVFHENGRIAAAVECY